MVTGCNPMNRRHRSKGAVLFFLSLLLLSASVYLYNEWTSRKTITLILASYGENPRDTLDIKIHYPLEGILFPPEIRSPEFVWQDPALDSDAWLIRIEFENQTDPVHVLQKAAPRWTPSRNLWEKIKKNSLEKKTRVTILGIQSSRPAKILAMGQTSFETSPDPVGAPIFFRELPLPTKTVVYNPKLLKLRLGDISSYAAPRTLLEKPPMCVNCHSFSLDGEVMGMEIDTDKNRQLDKTGYILTPIHKKTVLGLEGLFSWNAIAQANDPALHDYTGMLGRVSPDGQYVVSSVKDVLLGLFSPDLAFSQFSVPVSGVLAVYAAATDKITLLPGADDESYVHVNPVWSPDGKFIVFARAKVDQRLLKTGMDEPTDELDIAVFNRRYPVQYDLYRIPFNGGKGGKAEPLNGAAHNGMSNYFPKYSPDGKWIVFCQAKNGMLIQPDSQLYILPAEGGVPRKLNANRSLMNSWHSWSPNSRWLVFSSKAHSAYTQLFLTHIDENGSDTPPILLSHFNDEQRVANLPEFVNINPDQMKKIVIARQIRPRGRGFRASVVYYRRRVTTWIRKEFFE